jgi:hypothetical protein
MTLIIQRPTGAKLNLAKDFSFDADAAAYIAAVEAADTQALETATRYAINDFVIGCKQDGIWSAIKASCILSGARTLAGALIPLAGTAPTNVGELFVSGDYNRKTGLLGNGSTKYLNSNRNNNADPQDSQHLSIYQTSNGTNSTFSIGARASIAVASQLFCAAAGWNSCIRSNVNVPFTGSIAGAQFVGASRSSSSSYLRRTSNASIVQNAISAAPTGLGIFVFGLNEAGALTLPTASRLAFYSIGESLDLALLDARVTDLINAFGAAIP